MATKVQQTDEGCLRKSSSLHRYKPVPLLLLDKEEDNISEELVMRCAIKKIDSIINSLPGQRREMEMRKQVLLNTHIRSINTVLRRNEPSSSKDLTNPKEDVHRHIGQGVKASSARPEPDSDSDSSDSDSSDSESESSDSELSDSSESDSDFIEEKVQDQKSEDVKRDFEFEIEDALKQCYIDAKNQTEKPKKPSEKVASGTFGVKRKRILVEETFFLGRAAESLLIQRVKRIRSTG